MQIIKRKLKQYINFIIDTLIYPITFRTSQKFDLVIVRSDAIGDFILFISALECYRKTFIDKSIILVCPEQDEQIAIKSGLLNKVFSFKKQRIENDIMYHLRYMIGMKKIEAGMLINPTLMHQTIADYICAMIKSPIKIGTQIERIGFRNKLCDRFFTKLIKIPDYGVISELDAIEYFTRRVVNPTYKYTLSDLKFITNDYESQIEGTYCVIGLSSSVFGRIWPVENVAKLIRVIPLKYKIILSGYGLDDVRRAQYIIKEDECQHVILNYVNKTSIIDLVRIVSKSSFAIGNDSSIIHIAAACRISSVCYTPGAHYGRFIPYPDKIPEKAFHPHCVYYKMDCFGCNYRCRFVDPKKKLIPCLKYISVDMVKNELQKIIL